MKQTYLPGILIVEDSIELAELYKRYLNKNNFKVDHVTDGETAIQFLQLNSPKIVLLDYVLPGISGQSVLEYVNHKDLQCQVIVMTAHASVETAVTCMRHKTFDYLIKPFDATTLLKTINNALSQQLEPRKVLTENNSSSTDKSELTGFIGQSAIMQNVYHLINNAAPSIATVFISGKSGTGKEICARAIHDLSPRKNNAFIAINCAAIPRDLMESEIFGHIKGAFSGATSDRPGAATLADNGTLFLDEICEMDMELQTKLLRFVQTGSFQKVGSGELHTVDIRFICATNRNVLQEVEHHRFREDLYYRLHVIPIEMPSLKQRGQDIITIAEYYLNEYSIQENKHFHGLSESCRQYFLTYDWPGNVRQLQNIIRNIVVLNNADLVTVDMLPELMKSNLTSQKSDFKIEELDSEELQILQESEKKIVPLWVSEKKIIEDTIEYCDSNIPKAAALLGISPSTIYRKKEAWKKMDNKPGSKND
ncbi:MAG: sigma-54 dependent transcriptional regulator [Gammaproteobacteria bacterium]|nr:sigma-54 dependent transcriptional regulator [Gammaproteobacteria bacterium]